jgi:hypothetical protein
MDQLQCVLQGGATGHGENRRRGQGVTYARVGPHLFDKLEHVGGIEDADKITPDAPPEA